MVKSVPEHEYALVCGIRIGPDIFESLSHRHYYSNKFTHLSNRIDAAAALYHAGKAKKIIVFGESGKGIYGADQIKLKLMSRKVPGGDIIAECTDYADEPMKHIRKVYGTDRFIVVSQWLDCWFAIRKAEKLGYGAIGFEAGTAEGYEWALSHVREALARWVHGSDRP